MQKGWKKIHLPTVFSLGHQAGSASLKLLTASVGIAVGRFRLSVRFMVYNRNSYKVFVHLFCFHLYSRLVYWGVVVVFVLFVNPGL